MMFYQPNESRPKLDEADLCTIKKCDRTVLHCTLKKSFSTVTSRFAFCICTSTYLRPCLAPTRGLEPTRKPSMARSPHKESECDLMDLSLPSLSVPRTVVAYHCYCCCYYCFIIFRILFLCNYFFLNLLNSVRLS